MIELLEVGMKIPDETNIIIGQSHFIKTVEDLYEAMVHTPQARFGLAFNESSGECLIRSEGNDDELRHAAVHNAQLIGAGHIFVLLIQNAYPINALHAIRNVPEVCTVFCATANPVGVGWHKLSRAGVFWELSMEARRKEWKTRQVSRGAMNRFASLATSVR